MRRYAFGIVGTALALVVLPCLLLLTVDMEERRIAPLAGRWASVLHPGATADIRRGPECYILTLRRPGEGFRHGRTFRLRYRRGITRPTKSIYSDQASFPRQNEEIYHLIASSNGYSSTTKTHPLPLTPP